MLLNKTFRKPWKSVFSYPFTFKFVIKDVSPISDYQKIQHVNLVKQFHNCAVCNARKPRWLPLAPSKMFKIIEKPLLPEDENDEVEYHEKNYRTLMNSLWSIQKVKDREAITKYNIKVGSAADEISHLIAKNEIINAEVSNRRSQLQELEWAIIQNEILSTKAIKEKEEEERHDLQKKFVLDEIQRLKTAIKMEDLDDVILKAIGNVTDYNFSIDGKGKFYPGRHNVDKADGIVEATNINQFSIQSAV